MQFQIKINSLNQKILFIYYFFIKNILSKYKINYKIIFLPKKIKKFTLLKSTHVHKTAREQFGIIKYSLTLQILNINNIKILKFLLLNKPAFLKINIRKIA